MALTSVSFRVKRRRENVGLLVGLQRSQLGLRRLLLVLKIGQLRLLLRSDVSTTDQEDQGAAYHIYHKDHMPPAAESTSPVVTVNISRFRHHKHIAPYTRPLPPPHHLLLHVTLYRDLVHLSRYHCDRIAIAISCAQFISWPSSLRSC